MTLYKQITAIYPELADQQQVFMNGTIVLQNDSDGRGDYIKAWNHPTLSEPTAEQLAALEVTP
jgi:hypothetical protein